MICYVCLPNFINQLILSLESLEMDATKNVCAIGRFYGMMVYHITGISPENITCWLHC